MTPMLELRPQEMRHCCNAGMTPTLELRAIMERTDAVLQRGRGVITDRIISSSESPLYRNVSHSRVAGMTPTMELRALMERTEAVLQQDRGVIIEESVEGLPLVGYVTFRRADSGGRQRTRVQLNLAYYLPGERP